MTDRTGGPSSLNYAHRRRPEDYEEDVLRSEGQDAGFLQARSGARNDEEDERLRGQDLALTRSLRLRAEGFEKVLTSMLQQTLHTPPTPMLASSSDLPEALMPLATVS